MPYFAYFLIALVSIRAITTLISARQLKKYNESARDNAYIQEHFDSKEFESSQKYNAEKMRFSILHKVVDGVLEFALWFFFFFVAIWNWTDSLMASFGLCSDTPWIGDFIQAYLFYLILTLIQTLVNLPFSIYNTFVIEEKYEFNKSTPGTFILD